MTDPSPHVGSADASRRSEELLSRVKAATGPDRELDAAIDVAMFGGETIWKQANYTMDMYPASRRPNKAYIGGFANEHVPLVTSSVDAALLLVAQKLPGAEYQISNLYGIAHVEMPLNATNSEDLCSARRTDGNMPLAILEALFSVLVSVNEPRGLSASEEPCSEAVDPNTPPERAKGGE
jgi:hypothetical protein